MVRSFGEVPCALFLLLVQLSRCAVVVHLPHCMFFSCAISHTLFHPASHRIGTPVPGGCNYDAAIAYLTAKFKSRNTRPERREVYTKVTCATDKTNVRTVFNSCKTIILKQNMQGSGFME